MLHQTTIPDAMNLLVGPAVVAVLVGFLLTRIGDRLGRRRDRAHAVQAVRKEIEVNRDALVTFRDSFPAIRERVAAVPGYVPLIPVDRHSTLLFEEMKEHLLGLDAEALLAVVAYVKKEKQLNELLSEMGGKAFGEADKEERRGEILRYTEEHMGKVLKAADDAVRKLGAARRR